MAPEFERVKGSGGPEPNDPGYWPPPGGDCEVLGGSGGGGGAKFILRVSKG